jgi:hypothetical protein
MYFCLLDVPGKNFQHDFNDLSQFLPVVAAKGKTDLHIIYT